MNPPVQGEPALKVTGVPLPWVAPTEMMNWQLAVWTIRTQELPEQELLIEPVPIWEKFPLAFTVPKRNWLQGFPNRSESPVPVLRS
jgi:hypothetical protein